MSTRKHAIMQTGHSVYIDVEYKQIIHRHIWFYKDCTETIHTHRLHEFTTNIRTRYLTAFAGKTHTVFSHTNASLYRIGILELEYTQSLTRKPCMVCNDYLLGIHRDLMVCKEYMESIQRGHIVCRKYT